MAATVNPQIIQGNDDSLPQMLLECKGAPTDGTSGTYAGVAKKGQLLIDVTNANIYINANTKASPTWKLITRAA